MSTLAPLADALTELVRELRGNDIRLIVGGGYGIYLRHRQLLQRAPVLRTLLSEWPEPRSTSDLDLFLRAELLLDSQRLQLLAQALARLGYGAVPGAESYQFVRPGPAGPGSQLKIDLLTGPKAEFRGKLRVDDRRVHPKPRVGLHAHPVDEAPTLEVDLTSVSLRDPSHLDGPAAGEVFLPHPFTFAMMKIFALRDQIDDADSDYGRHHAMDLYTCVAMMTEAEWARAQALRGQYAADPSVGATAEVVHTLFGDRSALGMVRLREHTHWRASLQSEDFRQALLELFPPASP